MVEIIPTDMTPPENDSREFHPMRGVGNRHLQTMLPRLIRRKLRFTPHWQRLELPDGDFVDLAWSEDPHQACHKPRLVVFHGLEGSLHSPYAHGLIHAAMQRGWLGVVMHFRGCSGEPNRNHRIYHSGETEDGTWFLHWLQREFGPAPTSAIRWAAICWAACWQKKATAARWMRR
jgi:predicted alpha/beta-fold hydrolase